MANYIRNYIATNAETLKIFSSGVSELLTIYLKKLYLPIITIYRLPDTTLDQFSEVLQKITALNNLPHQSKEVILMGDFSFPHLNWSNMTTNTGTLDEKSQLQSS